MAHVGSLRIRDLGRLLVAVSQLPGRPPEAVDFSVVAAIFAASIHLLVDSEYVFDSLRLLAPRKPVIFGQVETELEPVYRRIRRRCVAIRGWTRRLATSVGVYGAALWNRTGV